jgi:hypothetical protein
MGNGELGAGKLAEEKKECDRKEKNWRGGRGKLEGSGNYEKEEWERAKSKGGKGKMEGAGMRKRRGTE